MGKTILTTNSANHSDCAKLPGRIGEIYLIRVVSG